MADVSSESKKKGAPLSTRKEGQYLRTLDGWRALAILLVLIAHASDSLEHASSALFASHAGDIRRIGLFGVQIFFGLSGLLITSRLVEEEKRHGRVSLRSFYTRRFFRILPPAFTYLIVIGTLAVLGFVPITFGRWLSSLLCFANYSPAETTWYTGHFWSLAVEEHFYFLWPSAFVLIALFRRRVFVGVGLALAIALWRAIDLKFHVTHSSAAYFWGRTDVNGDALLWGVVLALVSSEPKWREHLQHMARSRLVRVILPLSLVVLCAYEPHGWKTNLVLLSVKTVVIPLTLLSTMFEANRIFGRILESGPFRWVGRLSYSLYLWQQLFLAWDEFRIPAFGRMQMLPLNIVAVFICAGLSYYFIERPLISVGHKLAKRWSGRRKAVSAVSAA